MNNVEQLADRITRALANVKRGSLRFWGDWFGKPYDNFHELVKCEAGQDALHLFFDQEEHLSVWSPIGLQVDDSIFRIRSADRVRWEWFSYGRPKIAQNLYFIDFIDYLRSANEILVTTNADWYPPSPKLSSTKAAVEIL